ncbi:hypothetical protein ABW21_db0206947 [Orbilia brochopaga]|nr:hypothetical protein ABW21_db0206947 [Drechslerella brochopaga]
MQMDDDYEARQGTGRSLNVPLTFTFFPLRPRCKMQALAVLALAVVVWAFLRTQLPDTEKDESRVLGISDSCANRRMVASQRSGRDGPRSSWSFFFLGFKGATTSRFPVEDALSCAKANNGGSRR